MSNQDSTIPKDWESTTVGKLVDSGILFPPEDGNHGEIHPKSEDFVKVGVPFIMASDLKNGEIDSINCKFISEEQAKHLRKGFSKNGDVLLSHKATLGRTAIVNTKYDFIVLTPQVTFYRIKDNAKMSNQYLKYYFDNSFFQITLKNYSGGGSTRDYIGILKQLDLPVIFPLVKEQFAIASLLSSLDEKIDLLNKQNKTLKATAQAIFKEFFVNFNFPGSTGKMIDSKLGNIPVGWKVGRLSDIANFLNGLALQKYPPESSTEYLPVVKIKELNSGISEQSDRASSKLDKKYVVDDGDVLFSWSGSLLVDIWKYGKGALNQHLFKVTSNNYPKWFYFYWIKEHLPSFQQTASAKAVTMGHIQRHHLDDALVAIPNDQFMQIANNLFDPMISKLINNNAQIKTLVITRDTLLPKLIKGEVRVKVNGN